MRCLVVYNGVKLDRVINLESLCYLKTTKQMNLLLVHGFALIDYFLVT